MILLALLLALALIAFCAVPWGVGWLCGRLWDLFGR